MSIYEPETQPSDVHRNDTVSLPEMSEYLLAMRHELRAPLNAIIGMSALLLDDEVTPRQAQYVKSVHAAGESLSVILNDVLDLASVAANRLAIEPIPFDLKSMIEETASALTPKANERGLALRVDWRPELPRYLVGDPGRTRQIIGNLVGYAVNGTTHGEVVIRVMPDGERSGIPAIRFSVEDTGIGIAPDRLARIFDEYVPLDASPYRSFGVTGLGLRLSAELVRLMNGVIHAESEPGRGNRLWFSIPMPTATQYETNATTEPMVTGGGRALIVEADFSNRSRFAQQFQDAGWRVEFTAEIESVATQLRQAMADGDPYRTCIISHYAVRPIHMELARDLKADSLVAPVALVMVTAVGSPGDGQKLWNAGFAAYLRKPVPAEEIRESLEALSRLGPTGKGHSLITRHSLAEVRNAQSFEVEGIDEMLASLTAPAEPLAEPDSIESVAPSDEAEQFDTQVADATEQQAAATLEPLATAAPPEAASAPLPAALDSLLALPLPESPNGAAVSQSAAPVVESARQPDPVPTPGTESALQAATGEPQSLIGPAVPPIEASVSEPSLFRITLDMLAPPAIPPVADAAPEAAAAPAETSDAGALDAQLVFDSVPAAVEPAAESTASDEPAALLAPPSSTILPDPNPATEDLAVERSIEAVIEISDTAETDEALAIAGSSLEADVTLEAPVEAAVNDAIDEPAAQLPVSLIDGHQDALWESDEAVVPALEGLVSHTEETIDAPSAVIEAVALSSPGDYLAADAVGAANEVEPANASVVAERGAVCEQAAVVEVAEKVESTATVDPAPAVEAASVDDLTEATFAVNHGASEAIEATEIVVDASVEAIESILDRSDASAFVGAAAEPVGADPDLDPEPEIDVATFEVVSPQLLDGLSTGGGFFTQHVVSTFLRDGAAEVERLATAEGSQFGEALERLAHAAEWVGAARLSALVADAAGRFERTGRAGPTARIAAALAEARATLDLASPQGLPAELPAVGAAFAEQLSPAQQGSGRMLAVTLAGSFASEAPVRAAELRDAVAQGNTDAAQRLAQTLKGMCGLIGAEPLAKLAALVEADARLKRLGQTDRYLTHIDRELERVQAFLDQAQA